MWEISCLYQDLLQNMLTIQIFDGYFLYLQLSLNETGMNLIYFDENIWIKYDPW
jgi:hypothetical protein